MNSIENLKEISRVIRKDIVEMLTESAYQDIQEDHYQ